MKIGNKIKLLRIKRGLTQSELASRCEYTKGYISQLENDLASPSITGLVDVLEALGVTLKDFFADDDTEERVIFTTKDYIKKENKNCTINWLIPNAQKNMMEPILLEIKPGEKSFEDFPHEGEEFGFILQGSVLLSRGNNSYKLKKGDSFYYSANKIHFFENTGKDIAKILWVSTPPSF